MTVSRRGESSQPIAPTTIRTFAAALGVHPSTVSRALREGADGKVSAAMRARIRAAAAAAGYRPNPWASSLRTSRTYALGLLIPHLVDVALAQMFEGAEDRARQLGYQAITAGTNDSADAEQELAEGLLQRRMDGLIIATAPLDDPYLDALHSRNVPFILLNRASGDHPSVRGDDELGGFLATSHLLSQGHRRIGMVAGQTRFSTSALRLRGFEQAHATAGIETDPSLVIASSFEPEGGLVAGTQLLARSPRPTAVFAVNDYTAVGVMAAARDLGLRVPADLAVVGYNDSNISALLSTPLTSVALPLREMGARAVDLLMQVLSGDRPESVVIPPTLRVRASSMNGRARGQSGRAS
jgi:LacI family transcriptional regulator